MRRLPIAILLAIAACGAIELFSPISRAEAPSNSIDSVRDVDRSPVDLVMTTDERWIVTANQTSDTISLIDVRSRQVVDEKPTGDHPTSIAHSSDGRVFVACAYCGVVQVFTLANGELRAAGSLTVGFEPTDIAISSDSTRGYVSLAAAGEVAIFDPEKLALIERIPVGSWPRYLALSADNSTLAVACAGDRAVAVVDLATRTLKFQTDFGGINPGRLQISDDGQFAYFPWMIYRTNPINERNIRLGWVLGSRIARVRLDENKRREAITLDPPGEAVCDPHGIAISRDERRLVATGAGTHELLVYRLPGLPWMDFGGPGDHIDRQLGRDSDRFFRIRLGGRPMSVVLDADGDRAFVANYLKNSVQIVDLNDRAVEHEISLGGPATPSLARRGEAIFYDGRRSLDQWYSCHTCHYEGGGNVVPMDTMNDGTTGTFKTAQNLYDVVHTGPWTWHGWQKNLRDAMRKSLTETMLGPSPTEDDIDALIAYFETIDRPPNPHLVEGKLSPAAERGKEIFESPKAGCINCHNGPYFTDGQIHDVGLGSPKDAYEGYNTPSLRDVYRRTRLLHKGQARSLEEVVTGVHAPSRVAGEADLTTEEVEDLVAYLKSL